MAQIDANDGLPQRLTPTEQSEFWLGYYSTGKPEGPQDPATAVTIALQALAPEERLEVLKVLPAVVDAATNATVAELRGQKVTWERIGQILGTSRAAAQRRFRDLDTT